jgi:hypothetical protein
MNERLESRRRKERLSAGRQQLSKKKNERRMNSDAKWRQGVNGGRLPRRKIPRRSLSGKRLRDGESRTRGSRNCRGAPTPSQGSKLADMTLADRRSQLDGLRTSMLAKNPAYDQKRPRCITLRREAN